MPAFVPIYYREDGTYVVAMTISHHASKLEEIEIVPRSIMEETILAARLKGQVVKPYINYGFQ